MRRRASSSGYRGVLIDSEGVRHGYLVEGVFEESREEFDDFVITPTFFNAHTHLGDSIAKDPPYLELKSMVGPEGYKFRVLSSSSIEDLRRALIHEIEIARKSGTTVFLDFRESGIDGLRVVEGVSEVIALGRPQSVEEAEKMECAGFAMSSARDHDLELLFEIRKIARKKGVLFAIHAGEVDCGDVEIAVELEPDFVVHMNMCEALLEKFIEAEIPIVSCIRSNFFFDVANPRVYRELSDYEKWLLGTDNAMLFNPSMLEEMHFSSIVVKNDFAVFKASINGYRIFGEKLGVRHGYVVFKKDWELRNSRNLISTIVRRVSESDIEAIVDSNSLTRRKV
ncbi:MAG: amidohydrolase family protein [Archaeoglobaceae archaeon]